MTTEQHFEADEDVRDVRDHDAGEHAEAIVVDCYRCREDAEDLGMGARLPATDPDATVSFQCGWCGEVFPHQCPERKRLVESGHVARAAAR